MGGGGGPCGICETAAHLSCSGCGSIQYCGKEHQRQHWPQHRQECLPYKVLSSPGAGRYMVSSRRLSASQDIFEDTPLVVGPLGVSPLICLGCHDLISGPDFPRCPKCWWPLCSLDCAEAPRHQNECRILATDTKHIGSPKQEGETPRYDIILTLRCLLLKDHNPNAWKEVLAMAHHSQERVSEKELSQIATVQYLLDVLRINYKPEHVHQVKGAISTNSLEIRSENNTRLRALYPRIRLFNHACTPNVQLTCTDNSVMKARTADNVELGEPLCVCYTSTMIPLWERQNTLSNIYHFTCDCNRCNDPTENGTHFSCPRCPECTNCFLEPIRWLGKTSWVCPTCKTEESDAKVREGVTDWMERLQMDDIFGGNTIKQAISMLEQVEEEFHATHYMWMKVAQMVLYKLRYNDTYKALQLKRRIWQRLSALYSSLEPGLTKRRGMSLLETGSVMLHEAKAEYEAGQAYIPVLIQSLPSIEALLKEAVTILKLEPPGSQSWMLADRAEDRRKEAKEFIETLKSPKELRSE